MVRRIITRFRSLEAIAFVSGFVLMAYELVAARLLAPTIGSSVYVWTSVIGTVILALSIGYFIGGRLADKRAQPSDVAWLCLMAATAITSTLLLYQPILELIDLTISDMRLQGVVASLILFVPASIALGMLSPYLVKLRVTSLTTSGQSVASLSALNSIGGITGTFITGFVLFGYVGSRESLVLCIGAMIATSWLVAPRMQWWWRLMVSLGLLIVIIGTINTMQALAVIDTPSAHYTVLKRTNATGRTMTLLTTGPHGVQSGVYDDRPEELLFWYTQEMARMTSVHPSKSRILMLGGGTFTLPSYMSTLYPDSQIDVVEIDPELERIAKEYFWYRDRPNVKIIAEDARTYVNRTTEQYDIVLVDVYNDISVPHSLMTTEYGMALDKIVNSNGLVVVNSVSSLEGSCRDMFAAIHAVYYERFGYAAYTKDPRVSKKVRSNIIHIYARTPLSSDYGNPLALPRQTAFTDNFVPTERLQQLCLRD